MRTPPRQSRSQIQWAYFTFFLLISVAPFQVKAASVNRSVEVRKVLSIENTPDSQQEFSNIQADSEIPKSLDHGPAVKSTPSFSGAQWQSEGPQAIFGG